MKMKMARASSCTHALLRLVPRLQQTLWLVGCREQGGPGICCYSTLTAAGERGDGCTCAPVPTKAQNRLLLRREPEDVPVHVLPASLFLVIQHCTAGFSFSPEAFAVLPAASCSLCVTKLQTRAS